MNRRNASRVREHLGRSDVKASTSNGMQGNLLITNENGSSVKTYGVKYNKIYIMRNAIIYFVISTSVLCVFAEIEFYPGFRRPNPIIKWDKEQAEELAIEELANFLREQQRLLERQREPEYRFRVLDQAIRKDENVFGVAPPDPRYYEPIPEEFYQKDDYQIAEDEEDETNTLPEFPEAPEAPIPAEAPIVKSRSDESSEPQAIVPHLREQSLAKLVSGDRAGAETVYVKPVLQDDTAGVYVIAVVAGISAAATVGLIAFGIGWYNLQKNVKSASDVEYPAYGVTGPNKDVSPTGDRRLAQSAQMYHYQHQKQQIIAMERTAATDRHGSLSEAESDEENEEGDYTVYECPGLAPTGEMEVKNPLFQDDTTPAAQATPKTEEHSNQK